MLIPIDLWNSFCESITISKVSGWEKPGQLYQFITKEIPTALRLSYHL